MKSHLFMLSVAPMALLAMPAHAHAAEPSAPQSNGKPATKPAKAGSTEQVDTAVVPSKSANTDPRETSSSAEKDDDIVVTGLRASLESAAALKRNSDSIIDVVVAQDIGKLPDDTAAETIARIAGVQVQRYNDEVSGVLIRGLPDVATAYNGREIFTAELRRAQLQDFPSQALSALEVYKSGTADLIEPGLAGLVNVRTRRPFDFKGLEVAGGLRGTYNDQSRFFDPQGNILVSDRWDTGIGEMGLLVNVTYAQSRYHNGVRYNSTNIADSSPSSIITPKPAVTPIRYPYSVGLYNESGKRYRPSGNFSFQWAPASNAEVYLEGIYQGYRGETIVDNFDVDLRGRAPVQPGQTIGNAPTLSDVVLVGDTTQVASMTKSGGYRPGIYRSTKHDATNTTQIATGGKWSSGIATLSTDFAYNKSNYRATAHSLDSALTTAPTVKVNFADDGGAAFSFPDYDFANPANYIWRGYYESDYKVNGKGWQWRGDLVLEPDMPLLRKLQFGYRVTNRDANYITGNRYAYTESLKRPFADLPIGQLSMSPNPFRGAVQGFTSYLVPTFEGVDGNQAKLRDLSRQALQQLVALNPDDQGYKDALTKFQGETVPLDPYSQFHAKEQSYAGYVQAKYAFDVGSMEVDGVAGLRAVNTVGRYSGLSKVTVDSVVTATPRDVHQNYLDLLPNASMRVKFSDKLQLRLGYTYTRTRPDFGTLNPAVSIEKVVIDPTKPVDPTDPNSRIQAYGSGGNPDLRPLTSRNYDVSLEYYFAKSGSVTLAAFQHDLNGFINYYTRYVQDPTYGFMQISRPENSGEGKIKGVEAAFQTFFGFMPGALKGLGVQANATYLD
ncbi:TonB-dependent receptor [Sphingomonas phyllosphaerae]|uniref:TonB-dependent receptor n=1 Tax=Sphingomonas phyllosphaerae TaxID=257003 RepID=UPI00192E46F0|nr:TonB-dependent receptor [Sphingomonas phyllosphaerae]